MGEDFRFQKDCLKGICYSICGLGNSLYDNNFNKVAIELNDSLAKLQATCVAPLYLCDENTVTSKHSGLEGDVEYWQKEFFSKLEKYITEEKSSLKTFLSKECCMKSTQDKNASTCCNSKRIDDGACYKNGENEDTNDISKSSLVYEDTSDDENSDKQDDIYVSEIDEESEDEEINQTGKKKKLNKVTNSNGVIDMEDLGNLINKRNKKSKSPEAKEMLTPLLRKSLEKQGYKLIGTHSGVKLCRWTKSMLRGRGGCYKHTFYGIESHR